MKKAKTPNNKITFYQLISSVSNSMHLAVKQRNAAGWHGDKTRRKERRKNKQEERNSSLEE